MGQSGNLFSLEAKIADRAIPYENEINHQLRAKGFRGFILLYPDLIYINKMLADEINAKNRSVKSKGEVIRHFIIADEFSGFIFAHLNTKINDRNDIKDKGDVYVFPIDSNHMYREYDFKYSTDPKVINKFEYMNNIKRYSQTTSSIYSVYNRTEPYLFFVDPNYILRKID